jgi:hypothetical protein
MRCWDCHNGGGADLRRHLIGCKAQDDEMELPWPKPRSQNLERFHESIRERGLWAPHQPHPTRFDPAVRN